MKETKETKVTKEIKEMNGKNWFEDGWFLNGMQNLLSYSYDHANALNQSKYFTGIMIIIINMAPRFMTVKLNKTVESYIKYSLNRNVLIFAILWMGTRDVIIAFALTLVFMLLVDYVFNEESSLCCLPETFVDYHTKLRDEDEVPTNQTPTPEPVTKPLKLDGANVSETANPTTNGVASQDNVLQGNISGYSGY